MIPDVKTLGLSVLVALGTLIAMAAAEIVMDRNAELLLFNRKAESLLGAPPTAALAMVPPVPLPNLSWPATRTATLVDEAGMKIDSTSMPYFL